MLLIFGKYVIAPFLRCILGSIGLAMGILNYPKFQISELDAVFTYCFDILRYQVSDLILSRYHTQLAELGTKIPNRTFWTLRRHNSLDQTRLMYRRRYDHELIPLCGSVCFIYLFYFSFFVIRFMFFENIQTTHPSLVLGYNAAINIPDIFQCVQVILYYSNNCILFEYLI